MPVVSWLWLFSWRVLSPPLLLPLPRSALVVALGVAWLLVLVLLWLLLPLVPVCAAVALWVASRSPCSSLLQVLLQRRCVRKNLPGASL